MSLTALTAKTVFDGQQCHSGLGVVLQDGVIRDLVPLADLTDVPVTDLGTGTLAPGFVDLQVNGGAGHMLNDGPSVALLADMAQAHARAGATTILPTLITDQHDVTLAAIAAVIDALAQGVAGLAGLHLEGPHLDPRRAGAHDPRLIRGMTQADLDLYLAAVRRLPLLMLTVAPEAVSLAQIDALTQAGVVVSLGHTAADYGTCRAAIGAGARGVTHLFNAMSGLESRAPGLVGAALQSGAVYAGIIADGHHVDAATIAVALRAKAGPGAVYLVSDSMALTGSDVDRFSLQGREILRADGRLVLADGTLAGADLTLPQAVRHLVQVVGIAPDQALAMASAIPARAVGLQDKVGHIAPGRAADLVYLDDDLQVTTVWQSGVRLLQG